MNIQSRKTFHNKVNNSNLRQEEASANQSNKEEDIFSSLNISSNDFRAKKILCVFQKNSPKEKSFGVSHAELNGQNEATTISTGDFPLYSIDSFLFFISAYQPTMILIHASSDSPLLNMFLSNETLKAKTKTLPHMNIQFKSIQQIIYEYYQMNSELNQVCIYAKVNDILSSLSYSAQCALYTMFTIVLKAYSMSNQMIDRNDFVKFDKIYFDDMMFVNEKSQNELKIFEEKIHPSFVKGQGKSKEGLSLFNMFNKCLTVQGKKLLRNFFQFPLKNEELIKQRYDSINDFIKMKNYSIIKSLVSELSNIKDLDLIKNELQKFMINFKIWDNIFVTFNSILKIFEIFKTKTFQIKYLDSMFVKINKENIEKIFDFVCNCLDFSKDDMRPRVKKGVNELLDKLKEEFSGLDELLSKLALEYSEKIPKDCFMEKFMFVFIPQLGYMLAVEKNKEYYKKAYELYQSISEEEKKNNEEEENKMIEDSIQVNNKENLMMGEIIEEEEEASQKCGNNEFSLSFKEKKEEEEDIPELQNYEETLVLQKMSFEGLNLHFQFHSNEMIYYKNEITTRLDQDYGDLSARITDVENAIFREISKQILEFENDLQLTNSFISHLDVFINFYILSEKYTLYPPILPSSDILSFTDSRNLITELVNEEKYIKSSFSSNSKSIFLICGNISSGKSVFLRMIGMLVYLAQIGCYVPSKEFSFEVFTKLLSNIEINESSVDHMSGFTIELREIKEIIDSFNKDFSLSNINDSNVLILLDDPFKRSSSHNQRCLLGGVLKYFITKIKEAKSKEMINKKCKIFISISNESKLFLLKNGIIDKDIVDIYEMKTIVNEKKEMVNLYQLNKKDIDNSEKVNEMKSTKLFIAKENGLNNKLFLRSLEILNEITKKRKIFLNVDKIARTCNNFAINKSDLTLRMKSYCEKELVDSSKKDFTSEYSLLESLNKIFN